MQKAKKSGIFFRDVSKLFWILIPAMGMFLLVYFMGVLSPIQSQNNQNLQVGGIENKVQYLTSLVLTTPSGNELFLNYDEAGHYLKIGGTINADEISIGSNIGSQGSAILGGEGSSLNNVDNATLVGGNQNTVSNINNPTLLGGQGNEISSDGAIGELVTILGGEGNTINARGGENITIVGGENNTIIPAAGSSADNIVIFGSENQVRSQDTVILGQNVAVEGGVENIFVWSQSDDDFKPKTSNAFYVNTKNGLILNKTTGNASVDLAGAVKTIQYPDNLSNTGNVAEGTLIYVESGSLSAFCGYDGNLWVPLSEDASTHWLCFGSNQDACVGPLPKNIGDASHGGSVVGTLASNGSDVSKFSSDNYIPRRDAELGDWVKIPWTFNTLDRDTCAYGCGIGFHPGDDGLDGLYIGNCQACSPILNMYDWKTAGVGKDNCDFGCKASFAYDGADRTCEDCARGTYTAPNGHQLTSCSDCTKPQTIGIATEGFKDWVSNGVGINQCDYNCKPRFSYAFNGTTGGNTCTRCAVGTYSPGDQTPSCENCNNRQTIINYSVNGVNSSLDPSRYTSNGDAINTCSWECKAELGLEKNATSCVCPSGQHLELGVCTLNTKRVTCGGNIPLNAYAIPPSNLDGRMEIIRQGSWTNGSWPSALNRSYNAGGVSNASCKWECNAGFEINKNNNTECVAKTITVACGGSMPSSANNVLGSSSYTQTWNGYNYTPSKSWTQVSGTPGECQYRAKIISQCGSADGVASKYKPTVGLCDANATTTPVVSESSTQWSWTCRSSDNVTRSCAAPRLALEGGACNPSINGTTQTSLSSSPSLCAQGSVVGFTENPSASIYTNKWTWSCQGDTGTTKVDCVAHKRNDNKRLCSRTTPLNRCTKVGDPTSPKIGTSITPFANGTQWKCEEDVYCTVCNTGYTATVYDTQTPANCVAINASRDEDCPDDNKKTGVEYKLGATKYQQNSVAGGPWTPTINGWSYTNNSNPGSCQYTCAVDYLWDGDDCIPADQTRPASCPATAKPSGAGYILGATGFTQSSVDGGVNWSPSIPSSWQYVSSNPSYCEYTCATNYEWKIATQKCEPKTKIFDCISPTGELSGSWIRNTVNKYTQTWNGTAWSPVDTTTVYNTTASTTSCRYRCNTATGYVRVGNACVKQEPGVCKSVTLQVGTPNLNSLADTTLCTTGTPINKNWNNGTQASWRCDGVNGGNVSSTCTATCPTGSELENGVCKTIVVPKNGVCGTTNHTTVSSVPIGVPFACNPGSRSSVTTTTANYTWTCTGTDGGTPSGTCTACITGYTRDTVSESCKAPPTPSCEVILNSVSCPDGNHTANFSTTGSGCNASRIEYSKNSSPRSVGASEGTATGPRIFSLPDQNGTYSIRVLMHTSQGQKYSNVVSYNPSSACDTPPAPGQCKLDWNGKAFEWDPSGFYYDLNGNGSNIIKLGTFNGLKTSSDGCYSHNGDGGQDPDVGECFVSTANLGPYANAKLYFGCSSNQRCWAKVRDSSGRITERGLSQGNRTGTCPSPINGECGDANGRTTTVKPTTDLCESGTPSTVSGSGPWTWTCAGLNDGTNDFCSATIPAPITIRGNPTGNGVNAVFGVTSSPFPATRYGADGSTTDGTYSIKLIMTDGTTTTINGPMTNGAGSYWLSAARYTDTTYHIRSKTVSRVEITITLPNIGDMSMYSINHNPGIIIGYEYYSLTASISSSTNTISAYANNINAYIYDDFMLNGSLFMNY